MSGGGDSSYSPPSGPAPATHCATFTFDTVVASPRPAVVAGLFVGARCEVVLVGVAPGERIELWVQSTGEVLGAVTERWADLRDCLRAGFRYTAEVLTATSPVRVRVRPRPLCTPADLAAEAVVVVADPARVPAVGGTVRLRVDPGTPGGPVVVTDGAGHPFGTTRTEPVCLPDLLDQGWTVTGTVLRPGPPLVVSINLTR